jgi:hypothetical protein
VNLPQLVRPSRFSVSVAPCARIVSGRGPSSRWAAHAAVTTTEGRPWASKQAGVQDEGVPGLP